MVNFKRIAGVLESTMTSSRRMLLIVTALALAAGCATATKQPSLYDTQPDLLAKQYSPDEIKAIEQNFKVNPLQYSQQLGNLLLWQMHQKSQQFALEFAQTPELNDGVNAKEVKAMTSIYNLIKDLKIPRDLFEGKDMPLGTHKIIMEWRGNSNVKGDWSGFFLHMGYSQDMYHSKNAGKVFSAEPLKLEEGEDYINLEGGNLDWKSYSSKGDTDGIIVALTFPKDGVLTSSINNKLVIVKRSELLSKNQLYFNEKDGLEGTLIIKNASETNLTPESYAVRDMVLAGEGDYKFSAPLQALLWGYMDGKFKEGDNPLKNYQDTLEFVKTIWGEMEGDRWDKFDEVADRLNTLELFKYWVIHNLTYCDPMVGYTKSARKTFSDKCGDCSDMVEFARVVLGKAGYNVIREDIITESHVIGHFKDKKGNRWGVDSKYIRRGLIYLK